MRTVWPLKDIAVSRVRWKFCEATWKEPFDFSVAPPSPPWPRPLSRSHQAAGDQLSLRYAIINRRKIVCECLLEDIRVMGSARLSMDPFTYNLSRRS